MGTFYTRCKFENPVDAATRNDARAVELLLAHGADPAARTRIDELTTPLAEAERLNLPEVVKILRKVSSPQ